MTNTATAGEAPSHSVYLVEGDKENAFWTKIGSAWLHKDGDGFNVQMTAIPLTGRIVIRKRKPKQADQGE